MHLILFFTRGVSLEAWDKVGMLAREIALYKRLQQHGVEITFVTYGGKGDLKYSRIISGIHICCNRWGLSQHRYEKLIPILHGYRIARGDIIKTNQMNGAEVAGRSAALFHKPLIARCGYMWSKNAALESGGDSKFTAYVEDIEKRVFSQAHRIVLTSAEMAQSVIKRFPEKRHASEIIPNYVDTEKFFPKDKRDLSRPRLCYIGRLAPEKNIESLVTAVTDLDVELDVIGEGPLRETLEKQASTCCNIHFIGRVMNDDLPDYLQRSTAFIFPSLYEGHPKTPIEAMACGLPVIASDVSGVREVIEHDKTGWLCDTHPESIREGIRTVIGDLPLQNRLGMAGRDFVVKNFSLDRIVQQELRLYQSMLR